jgi:hypothetical protein
VIKEIDKLFIEKFESLINSLERMPHTHTTKTNPTGKPPKSALKGKNSRRLH